ncbi:hypothetical protein BGAL_0544g00040 [Botrytis galanthina]|uniref:NADAR domain-containing protein n=1 Tax=Botrytis galanthina TaxID=278940 RepID=A0A4S8QJJ5_9HELO|nr:hypothetical protein BGAL_0544g00040 [Botrytis galanthina]
MASSSSSKSRESTAERVDKIVVEYDRIAVQTSGGKLPCASIIFDEKTRTNYKFFSNSYAGNPIASVGGVRTYVTAVHYFGCLKAFWVGDDKAWAKVYKAKTASDAKKIGESLEVPDDGEWENDILLVYSGEKDLLWVNGLTTKQTKGAKVTTWPGKNLLGEMLMQVRHVLRNSDELDLSLHIGGDFGRKDLRRARQAQVERREMERTMKRTLMKMKEDEGDNDADDDCPNERGGSCNGDGHNDFGSREDEDMTGTVQMNHDARMEDMVFANGRLIYRDSTPPLISVKAGVGLKRKRSHFDEGDVSFEDVA